MRCNKCHRPMLGTTAYDGACECGGLIEATPSPTGRLHHNDTVAIYNIDRDGKAVRGEMPLSDPFRPSLGDTL